MIFWARGFRCWKDLTQKWSSRGILFKTIELFQFACHNSAHWSLVLFPQVFLILNSWRRHLTRDPWHLSAWRGIDVGLQGLLLGVFEPFLSPVYGRTTFFGVASLFMRKLRCMLWFFCVMHPPSKLDLLKMQINSPLQSTVCIQIYEYIPRVQGPPNTLDRGVYIIGVANREVGSYIYIYMIYMCNLRILGLTTCCFNLPYCFVRGYTCVYVYLFLHTH